MERRASLEPTLTNRVVARAFLAAALGWVLLLSGPARAEDREVVGSCAFDASGVLRIIELQATAGGSLPADGDIGGLCVQEAVLLRAAGFIPDNVDSNFNVVLFVPGPNPPDIMVPLFARSAELSSGFVTFYVIDAQQPSPARE